MSAKTPRTPEQQIRRLSKRVRELEAVTVRQIATIDGLLTQLDELYLRLSYTMRKLQLTWASKTVGPDGQPVSVQHLTFDKAFLAERDRWKQVLEQEAAAREQQQAEAQRDADLTVLATAPGKH